MSAVVISTFDSSDGVLSVLWLVLRRLSLRVVLHRMLVHPRVSGQEAHVVLLTVVADGAAVPLRLLEANNTEVRIPTKLIDASKVLTVWQNEL